MRPPRPFGLTLAVLVAWLLFSLIPLVITALVFYINQFLYRDASTGAMSGFSLTNFQVLPFAVLIAAAVYMGFVGVFTWRGRPAFMRFVFPLTVSIYTAVTVLGVAVPLLAHPPGMMQGADSGQPLFQAVFSGYSGLTVLAALYCVWFSNRWSARAFFRGRYTPQDEAILAAYRAEMTPASR